MRHACALVAAGSGLILAACTLPATTPLAPTQPSAPASTEMAPSSTPTAGSSSPAPTQTPLPSVTAAEEPVASRPGSIDKVGVTAQVFPVRRSGGTATVDLYIASKDSEDEFMIGGKLGDGNTETSSKSLSSVDGIRLLDTTAKKAYLPAITADGACVCSPDDASTLTFNSAVWVTVTFAAPPTDVSVVSVSVPTFGTFTDVPVV